MSKYTISIENQSGKVIKQREASTRIMAKIAHNYLWMPALLYSINHKCKSTLFVRMGNTVIRKDSFG